MLKRTQILVEGVSAFRAVDKLNGNGIGVLNARKTQKNALLIELDCKDVKKGFAILRGSCYNVKKVRDFGVLHSVRRRAPRWGLVLGAALFLACVSFAQSRVLRVDVVGSGAYYATEVLAILRENGVQTGRGFSQEESSLTAQILSLPRVSFCSIKLYGGILTVEVQVSDEGRALTSGDLLSPYTGEVRAITAVRGIPLVAVGDRVERGDALVQAKREDGTGIFAIASVQIAYSFRAVYTVESREEAYGLACLEFGEIEELALRQTEGGWLAEGRSVATVAINMI